MRRRRANTREKHGARRELVTGPWRWVRSAGPAAWPGGVTLPAAPEGGLISFPRAAEVSAKCLSHLFKFYGTWPVAAGLRPGEEAGAGAERLRGPRGGPARQGEGQEPVPGPPLCLDPRAGLLRASWPGHAHFTVLLHRRTPSSSSREVLGYGMEPKSWKREQVGPNRSRP